MFTIKVIHVHKTEDTAGEEIVQRLEYMRKQLDFLTLKIETIMNAQERFDAILTRLDAVTTNLAADFKLFIEEARDGEVSDESFAKAEANIAILEQLAASKENPVPGEETPPVEGETAGNAPSL